MLKIKNKIKFSHDENRMKSEGDVKSSIDKFKKNKNLHTLLKERFSWMNDYIKNNDKGLEVGAAAGFSKYFIKCKNFKISDFSNHDHLDYKNIDAQNTGFENEKFDFVISSNMIHHLPFPLIYFEEMHRILKSKGKLIIFDAHCSLLLQSILILMKILHLKKCECFLFLNSGGVTSKTFYVPLNNFILKLIIIFDKCLSRILPSIFALGYKIVLEKK